MYGSHRRLRAGRGGEGVVIRACACIVSFSGIKKHGKDACPRVHVLLFYHRSASRTIVVHYHAT